MEAKRTQDLVLIRKTCHPDRSAAQRAKRRDLLLADSATNAEFSFIADRRYGERRAVLSADSYSLKPPSKQQIPPPSLAALRSGRDHKGRGFGCPPALPCRSDSKSARDAD